MTALAIDETLDHQTSPANDAVESPKFSFRCGNRSFSVWTQPLPDGSEVCVACELGHLPYSAENRERRRNGLMLLSAAGAVVSARLILTDFHRISLLGSVAIDDIEDPKAVVTGAAASVIGMLPLIDLMETCVVPTPPTA